MSDELRFATSGMLDEAFFRENAKYMLTPQFQRRRMILAIAVNVLCIAEYIWLRSPALLWLLAFYWITYFPFTLWYRHAAVKTQIRRFRESYPDGRCELATACSQEGVWCENRTSGGSGTVKYESLHTMAVAEHALILLTKAGQLSVCFTDELTGQEQNDLRAYLREKAPQMKVIR